MEQNANQILFALLRSAVSGALLTEDEKAIYSDDTIPSILEIAENHDVSHLLAWGLYQNGLYQNRENTIETEIIKAVQRYEQMSYAYAQLCDALEKAEISFLPLKGSVMRSCYPEPWMRTSSDIDILVREEDIEKAVRLLNEEHGYVFREKSSHDYSMYSNGVLLELHYALIREGYAKASPKILSNIWAYSMPLRERQYQHELKDEMFYFYHVAHMAKHFEVGGCGVRPFIDLWLLNNLEAKNREERENLLRQGGLLRFARLASQLSRVWLGGADYTELTKQMEAYVLSGGVYGTRDNYVAVQQQKKGGRIKYLLFRFFMPYSSLKYKYPVLERHRWLMPAMQVRRWLELLFNVNKNQSVNELRRSLAISQKEAENMKNFLKNVGLE